MFRSCDSDTSVGFTTTLRTGSSKLIPGDNILFNQGNAYNGTVFTCPSPGIYLFIVTLVTNTRDSGIYIYKNSKQLTMVYTGPDPQANGASVSAAVWLDIGDEVYLLSYHLSMSVDGDSAFTGIKVN